MRVLFAGDIHGNTDHMSWVGRIAHVEACDYIVACGDFGYWPHFEFGQSFLRHVDDVCRDAGVNLVWVDGNHENHDVLSSLRGDGDDLVFTGERHAWLPRGAVIQLGDLTVMGHGGAYSVDWEERSEGVSWWRGETISEGDLRRLAERQLPDVDILVTHEAPFPEGDLVQPLTYKDYIPASWAQRERVTDIVGMVEPSLVFCGHHHRRASFFTDPTASGKQVRVNVLGRDTMGGESVFVMDMTHADVERVRTEPTFVSVVDGNEIAHR